MTCSSGGDNSHSTSSTPEELGSYPFLWHETLVTTGDVHNQAAPTFADGWPTIEQPESVARPSTSFLTGMNYGEHFSILSIDLCLTRESLGPVPYTVASYSAPATQLPLARGLPAYTHRRP